MCCTLSNYADGREITNESEPVEETNYTKYWIERIFPVVKQQLQP